MSKLELPAGQDNVIVRNQEVYGFLPKDVIDRLGDTSTQLATEDQTALGAINELKSNLTDLTTNTDSTSGNIHFTKENKMRRVDLQWTSYSALKSFFNNLSSDDKPKGTYVNIVTTTVNSYYVNLAFVECNATNIICYRCSAYNNGNITFTQCSDSDAIKGSFTWYVD